MTNKVYGQDYRLNDLGIEVLHDAFECVHAVMLKYVEQGCNPRDIANILALATADAQCDVVLRIGEIRAAFPLVRKSSVPPDPDVPRWSLKSTIPAPPVKSDPEDPDKK